MYSIKKDTGTHPLALREDSLSIADPRLGQAERLAVVLGTEGDGLASDTNRPDVGGVHDVLQHGHPPGPGAHCLHPVKRTYPRRDTQQLSRRGYGFWWKGLCLYTDFSAGGGRRGGGGLRGILGIRTV